MKKLISIGLLIAAVTTWLFWPVQLSSHRFVTNSARMNGQSSSSHSPPIPPRTKFSTYVWTVGDSAAWSLQTSLRLSKPDEPSAAQLTELSGILRMQVLAVNGAEIKLLAAMENADYQTAGVPIPPLIALFETTPCLITLEPCGKLRSLAFPAGVAEQDRRILRLAFGWQVVVRPENSYSEQEEEDIQVQAQYFRDKEAIMKYRFTENAKAGTNYQTILSSRFTNQIGHLWLQSMQGAEETEMVLNSVPFLHGSIGINLQATNCTPSEGLLEQWRDKSQMLTLKAAPGAHSVTEDFRREALKEKWSSVPLGEMTSALNPAFDVVANVGPLKNLREWIGVHDSEGVNEVLAILADPNTEQGVAQMLAHALATTDAELAHQGHMLILKNPDAFSEHVLNQALVSATLEDNPTPELIAAVTDLFKNQNDPNNVALFSAAALARFDDGLARELVQRLSPDFAENSPADKIERGFMAMTQAGIRDEAIISWAEKQSLSEDASVRLAAIRYLHEVTENPEAIANLYRADADARIRSLFDTSVPDP